MPGLERKEWILLLLRERPLDRIRLMKALFLVWHRSGRQIEGFYEFVPYIYGPCSFDLYRELEAALREQLITQAPHPVHRWARYFLTAKGLRAVEGVAAKFDLRTQELVRQIASEVAAVGFKELLRRVYSEAPEFASHSVVDKVT